MIAVAILGLITITLYQFVDTTLRAANFSEKSGNEEDALAGLRRLLTAQLDSIPAGMNNTLLGSTDGGKGARRDTLQMVCPAGNALLAPQAVGFYTVTLDLREQPRGSGRHTLYMERTPWSDEDDGADDTKVRHKRPSDELALLPGVRSLEFAYFDARLNSWVDKWTDLAVLPNLVRVRITIEARTDPFEAVLRVPGGGLTRLHLLPSLPNVGNGVSGALAPANGNGAPAAPPNYVPPAPPGYVPPAPPRSIPQPPPDMSVPAPY
jgi:hypothetical protein